MSPELLVLLAEKMTNMEIAGGPSPEIAFLGNVRSKLIDNYGFAPAQAEAVLLSTNTAPIPEEYLSEDQLDRLAAVLAKNIHWASDQMAQAGFEANPAAIAQFVGRAFKAD